MSLASPLLALTLIWATIYILHYSFKPSVHSLLPSSTTARFGHRHVWNDSSVKVVLRGLHVRIQTNAWNLAHDLLATSLRRRQSYLLKRFYDMGSVMGLVGMLGALGFLCTSGGVSAISLIRKLWLHTESPSTFPETRSMLARREVDSIGRDGFTDGSWIKPVIPGLTVPLSHLPIILLSVFLAQIVHELGHAIAAAVESLPIISTGISFTVMIPSAFVSFSGSAMDTLAPRARARIIAAGPFHNFLLWCLLISIGWSGLGGAFLSLGYQDISTLGTVVIGVDAQSPLVGYLSPGSVITAIDDIPLGSQNPSAQTWTSILTQDRPAQSLGWCAGPLDGDDECCSNNSSGLSCFVSTDTSSRGCLNPIPILTDSKHMKRCTTTTDCLGVSICVQPAATEHLLRLTVGRGVGEGNPEIVLWSGPPQEIWEQVKVSALFPRLFLLPFGLPLVAATFWEYVLMATLSLYLFNLLPLPYLDGSQFITTLLQLILDDNGVDSQYEYDLEALEPMQNRRSSRRNQWWKEMLSRFIPRFTLSLFAACTLLGVGNAYWTD